MKKYIQKIEKRFNALSMREKVFICAAVFTLVYMSWHTILYDYVLATDEEIAKRAQQIKEQISKLEGQIDTVSEVLGRNPTFVLMQQSKDLKKENAELDKKISEGTKSMVSPKAMNKIIADMIEKSGGLTIASMESLESKPLFPASTNQQGGKSKPFQVYNHGLKVEMVGGYLETLSFLKALELKKVNVIWDEINYEVKKYPKARIILILHTLSLHEGWIDV